MQDRKAQRGLQAQRVHKDQLDQRGLKESKALLGLQELKDRKEIQAHRDQ
jgi:hypothetical protein